MKKIIIIAISLALASEASAAYWYATTYSNDAYWGPFSNYSACGSYLNTLRSQGFYGVSCVYR